MVEGTSLLARFTSVIGRVGAILNQRDVDIMDRAELKLVGSLKHMLADTRLDIRDWEMADSREEMQRSAREALHRLEQVRELILQASQKNIFSAVDVAEISAQFDRFAVELRR
jgi:hypothetical protein